MTATYETIREVDGWVAVALVDGVGSAIGRGVTPEAAELQASLALEAAGDRVSASLARPPRVRAGETYEEYLRQLGLVGPQAGFGFTELVRGDRRRAEPPRQLWPAIVPTLRLAILLRSWWLAEGGSGLRINAAYRREGGTRFSRHRFNAALDLDLLKPDHGRAGAYLRLAARVWREHQHLAVGVGTYHGRRVAWTRRIHVDACTAEITGPRPEAWQIAGTDANGKPIYVQPPAVLRLAKEVT